MAWIEFADINAWESFKNVDGNIVAGLSAGLEQDGKRYRVEIDQVRLDTMPAAAKALYTEVSEGWPEPEPPFEPDFLGVLDTDIWKRIIEHDNETLRRYRPALTPLVAVYDSSKHASLAKVWNTIIDALPPSKALVEAEILELVDLLGDLIDPDTGKIVEIEGDS